MKARWRQLLRDAALVAAELTLYAVIGLGVLVVMAHQLLLGLGLLFMACWVITVIQRRVLKRRMLPRGCCPICRYDLTGNVSGTCPECGTPFEVYARSGAGGSEITIRPLLRSDGDAS